MDKLSDRRNCARVDRASRVHTLVQQCAWLGNLGCAMYAYAIKIRQVGDCFKSKFKTKSES